MSDAFGCRGEPIREPGTCADGSPRRHAILEKLEADLLPLERDARRNSPPHGSAVFVLPELHRRRLRTRNVIERLRCELHRRNRIAMLLPNDTSLLRRASAMAVEISEAGRLDSCA